MQKITIKKTEEEETYRQITTTMTFEVNGKMVRVYCYDKQDPEQSNYENDTEVDEDDIQGLSELEHEVFGENLSEWLDLKVGTEQVEEIDEE